MDVQPTRNIVTYLQYYVHRIVAVKHLCVTFTAVPPHVHDKFAFTVDYLKKNICFTVSLEIYTAQLVGLYAK